MRKRVGLVKPSLQPIVPLVATFVSGAWGPVEYSGAAAVVGAGAGDEV